jgi:hypothetical protein
MNAVVLKGALKMLKNFISPDQIKEAARGMMADVIDYKNKIQLNEGETEVTAIFYEVKGLIYFSMAIIDKDNKIVRFEQTRLLDEVIDELIKKL